MYGIEIVVLYSIAGTINSNILQSIDRTQSLELDFYRQRRRKSVEIIFLRVFSFGLDKKLMRNLVGKSIYFGLYTRAISRTDTFYLSVVDRRLIYMLANNFVSSFVCVCKKTRPLLKKSFLSFQKRKTMKIVFARLFDKFREIYGISVDTHGGSRLHPIGYETDRFQLLGKSVRRGFGDTSSRYLYLSKMH